MEKCAIITRLLGINFKHYEVIFEKFLLFFVVSLGTSNAHKCN